MDFLLTMLTVFFILFAVFVIMALNVLAENQGFIIEKLNKLKIQKDETTTR
jgi:hypothetical protein